MEVFTFLKCLLSWSFLLLCINGKFLCMEAANFIDHPSLAWQKTKGGNYFLHQFRHEMESHHRQGPASAKTFLDLILGVVDTLQFGKRKFGTPS